MTNVWKATATNASTIPAKGVDAWVRTIGNAYKAAKRTGATHFVGANYAGWFIDTEDQEHAIIKVEADGTVSKRDN